MLEHDIIFLLTEFAGNSADKIVGLCQGETLVVIDASIYDVVPPIRGVLRALF